MAWERVSETENLAGVVTWPQGDDGTALAMHGLSSTSSVYLGSYSRGSREIVTLRMYNIDESKLDRVKHASLLSKEDVEFQSQLEVCPNEQAGRSNIGYIDAEAELWLGAPPEPGTLWFDLVPYDERDSTYAIQSTCIPRYRHDDAFSYVRFDYSQEGGWLGFLEDQMVIQHGGVCVVELPDEQGWLMVLQRRRMPGVSDAEGFNTVENRAADARAITFSDIVCYWAPDSTFTEGIEGPYWLVDACDAWRTAEDPDSPITCNGSPMRFRTGVPGVAIVGDELFIYYPVDQSGFFAPEADAVAGGDKYGDCLDPKGLDFHAGIGLKRIRIEDLLSADPGDDSEWDYLKYRADEPVDYTVPGIVCGLVRVWVDENERNPVGAVTAFTEVDFGKAAGVSFIDPAPVVCGETIVLFTAVTKGADSSHQLDAGMGLWRLTSIPPRAVLVDANGAPLTIEYGVDFIARPSDWIADIVREEGVNKEGQPVYSEWQNPDPVQLPDGSWRVYTSGPDGWMHVWVGEEDDGCRTPDYEVRFGAVLERAEVTPEEGHSPTGTDNPVRGGAVQVEKGRFPSISTTAPPPTRKHPWSPGVRWVEDTSPFPVGSVDIGPPRDPRAPNLGRPKMIRPPSNASVLRGRTVLLGGPLGVRLGKVEIRLDPRRSAPPQSAQRRAAAAIGRLVATSAPQARATAALRRMTADAEIVPLPSDKRTPQEESGSRPKRGVLRALHPADPDAPCGCRR